MVIHVDDSAGEAARRVADSLERAIGAKPDLVLGLAAGRTPLPVYTELKRRHASGRIDFSRVTTFNLDEFVGLGAAHPGSFRRVMHEQLFDGINVHPERIGFLDGAAADVPAECHRYEAAIAAAGGIDIQLLGIGTNGHIGFNEPADHLVAATHRTSLLPATRAANAALFGGDTKQVPKEALTMGIGTILGARDVWLMAFGEQKARCIEAMVRGPVTTMLPASLLQLHSRVELFLDRGAASRLS